MSRFMKRMRKEGLEVPDAQTPKPSGKTYADVMNYTQFLQAFFKDYNKEALTPRTMEMFELFVMMWKWKGSKASTMEVQTGEREDQVKEIPIPPVADFTYNPENKSSINDLLMPYGDWLNAMVDFKVNTMGPSRRITEAQERERWGGPVDISRDAKIPDIASEDALERMSNRKRRQVVQCTPKSE